MDNKLYFTGDLSKEFIEYLDELDFKLKEE